MELRWLVRKKKNEDATEMVLQYKFMTNPQIGGTDITYWTLSEWIDVPVEIDVPTVKGG